MRRVGLMGNQGTGNEAGGLHFALGGVRAVGVPTAGALADFTPVARPAVQRFMVSVSSGASRSTPPIESIQHAAERSERTGVPADSKPWLESAVLGHSHCRDRDAVEVDLLIDGLAGRTVIEGKASIASTVTSTPATWLPSSLPESLP